MRPVDVSLGPGPLLTCATRLYAAYYVSVEERGPGLEIILLRGQILAFGIHFVTTLLHPKEHAFDFEPCIGVRTQAKRSSCRGEK